ncbi:hypothetical protein [Streptomyces longwoodensis]|uniref:Uncharacterized protein n=1 Tax=Streptomyces longwoodensis TaxID=68231 RepID=A0A101QZD9_9ACTN|nr:hypothetical protein [Streptomyces longwoodensis]KUN38837.1 hypothetical protein AQJ30_11995 [Streptomyces longwoodensis]
MISDWLTQLAAAGSAALVSAASTDAWQTTRDRFVRLLSRGDPDRVEAASRRLDALRHTARTQDGDRALAEARRTWQVRLQDLLEEHPEAADELRSTIASLPPPRPATTSYRQQGTAQDHGKVFMNQHGDQIIRETRPGTPDA